MTEVSLTSDADTEASDINVLSAMTVSTPRIQSLQNIERQKVMPKIYMDLILLK